MSEPLGQPVCLEVARKEIPKAPAQQGAADFEHKLELAVAGRAEIIAQRSIGSFALQMPECGVQCVDALPDTRGR